MKTRLGWKLGFLTAFCCVAASGCVERRFVITSEPPGAVVQDENGQYLGATPVDKQFTYYGNYRFTLLKGGYETLVVNQDVRPPWYERFPLDFFAEVLWPFQIRDVRRLHYTLQPAQMVPPETVLENAGGLRQRGKNVQTPGPLPAPEAQ